MRPAALLLAFVCAAQDGTIRVPVDVERFSQTMPAECVIRAGARNPIAAVAFHPDGKLLAAGGYGEVVFWDVSGARLARRLDVSKHGANVRALAFSSGGALAVAAGTPGRTGAVLLDGTMVLEQSKDEFLSIAFSADGKWLAAGGADGVVRVWDVAARKLATALKEHGQAVTALAFTPDGKYLATGGGDRTVRIWTASAWEPVVSLPSTLTEPVTSLAFSSDGQFLAFTVSGATENAVRLWRVASADPVSGDDARAAVRRAAQMKQTRAFDTGAGAPLAVAWGKPTQIRAARPRLFIASSDGNIRILGQNGQVALEMAGHTDWVHTVAASPDGNVAASAGSDGTVRLWSAFDGRLLATLVQVMPQKDDWVIVTPRGHYTASSGKWVEWKSLPDEFARGLDNAAVVRTALSPRPAFRRPAR